jgi:hypothetical protein
MIYNRLLTIADVADYLQMSDDFVEREIHLDNLDAIYIGDDWRIEPSAAQIVCGVSYSSSTR